MRRIFYFQAVKTPSAIKPQIDTFLDHLAFQKRYSRHTIAAYRNDLYAFADFCETTFEIFRLEDVAKTHIRSFTAHLSEDKLLARSINRKISAVQSLFEHAMRYSGLAKNPARNIQRPKPPKPLPSVLRTESVDKLFNEPHFPEGFEGTRDRLMLIMLYVCGLRREELVNLNLGSIDHHHKAIRVLGKRNKERILPVSDSLLDMFREYLELRKATTTKEESLFVTAKGKKIYAGLVYKTVKKYLAAVTTMGKRSPHVLRHTFATHLLNEGANLQSIKELLGHASLASTQVYTHTSLDKLKEVYRKSHPKNQNK